MAAGDYVVRRNNANTDTVPNAGSTLTLLWDTAVASVGSGITYSAGTFTLGETGRFLVLCSDQEGTTSTTNNERINTKMVLVLGGTELDEGYCTEYIRKTGGSQECIHYSAAIIEVTSTAGTADELLIRKERIDNTVGVGQESARIADRSGITIIKLDDNLNYARYRSSAITTTSATDNATVTMNLQTTLEQDSPFTRTTNTIDIATTNPVLAIYSLKSEDPSPSGRAEYQSYFTLAGNIVDGSYNQVYIRVTDNTDWGGCSVACILEPNSGDDLELVVVSRDGGNEDFTATVQLVELPSGTEYALASQPTQAGNLNAANTPFAFSTATTVGTGFSFTGGNSNIDVGSDGDYLAFAALGTENFTNAVRAVPAISFSVNGTERDQAGASSYNRNSGTSGWAAFSVGTLLTGLSTNDSIRVLADRVGTNTATITAVGQFSVIRLSSLFAGISYDLSAEVGTYSYTGGDATLEVRQTIFDLTAEGGTYSYTGGDATLTIRKTYPLTAEGGTYSYSGNPAALTVRETVKNLVASQGTYSYTGGDATFEVRQTIFDLTADGGTYSYTGGDATLSLTAPAESYTLVAKGATYSYSGSPAYLNRDCATADFTDDFAIVGGAGDDFDCEATTGWTASGGAANFTTSTTRQQGSNSLTIKGTANNTAVYTHDIGVGDRFKITSTNLHFWFFYIKGKGSAILPSASTAIIVRLFFGGTTDFADYRVTDAGNDSLNFGWNLLQCSGRELNGGTFNFTDSDANWQRDIHRVELRVSISTGNDGTGDPDLLMDAWFTGTTITVESGTRSNPVTFDDIENYSNTRSAFPLGLVKNNAKFVNMRCGLQVGSPTTTCCGWVEEKERLVLFNQASEDVKATLTVNRNSGITFGEKEISERNYAVRGCQIVLPADRFSDIDIKNGGTLEAYNSKFFRWRDIFMGATSDTDTVIDLQNVQIDSCETAYFRGAEMTIADLEVYNNTANDRDYAGEMTVAPLANRNMLFHDCVEAMYFSTSLTLEEYFAQDNANADIVVQEGDEVTLINSIFDDTKIRRLP
jgi:hypothetical protein